MLLVGMMDSPFGRRVMVTLNHYGIACGFRSMSVFADFDELREINPLGRAPVLILEGGEALADSTFILDYLDELAPADRLLVPRSGLERRHVLQVVATGLALMEKSVALSAETRRRAPGTTDAEWADRLRGQITAALDLLEVRAKAAGQDWLCGPDLTQADVTAAVAVTNLSFKDPDLLPAGRYPHLLALTERCEALDAFTAAPYDGG